MSLFRELLATMSNEPPIEYTPLECLISTGTQYIDTGYKMSSNNIKYEAKCSIRSLGNYTLWGTARSDGWALNPYANPNYGGNLTFWSGTSQVSGMNFSSIEAPLEKDLTIVGVQSGTSATVTINGISRTKTAEAWSYPQATSFKIFGAGDGSQLCYMWLYSFKLYDNNVLVRDYIPVLDSNDVPCLYEKLSGEYYYNAGSGTFNYMLPYQEAEYIQSSGTQYIDTGIVPKSTTRMVLDMRVVDTTGMNARNGWGSSNSQEAFYCGTTATGVNFWGCSSNNWSALTLASKDNNRHTFDISNNAIKLDGTNYGTGNIGNTATNEQTLYLFALHTGYQNTGGIYYQSTKERIYSCKIYDGNNLVRDFIPVLARFSTGNVPCLYDKVSGEYFYNSGTGDFIAGNNI